jgi:hypothetical protein
MKLYEINETYQQLLDLELSEEDFQLALQSLEVELTDKATNIGYIMQNMDSDVIALDTEIKRLQAKKQAIKGRYDGLKQYLSETMQNIGEKKIETPLFTFSLRKSEKMIIDDNTLIPAIYKESIVTEKIDKKALKKAYKEESLPGCHIEVNQNLQVR